MAGKNQNQTPPVAEQLAAANAPADPNAVLLSMLGPVQYIAEKGAITLYPDKRRAGVKNGKAGSVIIGANPYLQVSASIYMDVERVKENGREADKRTYRLSLPKNVKAIFADTAQEKQYKRSHVAAWMKCRTAKLTTSDASGDDASISEIDGADEN